MSEPTAQRCAHGVPVSGTPTPRCDHCELIWEHWCLERARAAVTRHEKRVAFLNIRIQSLDCGDA